MDLVKCTGCKVTKPATGEYFPQNRRKLNKLDSWCRRCHSVYRQEIHRGKYRKIIADEDLRELKRKVKRCLICNAKEALVVDHDHTSQTFRGLLCQQCNLGLGHFRDNSDSLVKAAEYLNKHRAKHERTDK